MIRKLLHISPIHLSAESLRVFEANELLPGLHRAGDVLQCLRLDVYGWLVNVPDEPALIDAADLPADLKATLHFARRHDCNYVMVDSRLPPDLREEW